MRRPIDSEFANGDWDGRDYSERDALGVADPERRKQLRDLYGRLLEAVGEDPTRNGLVKTPDRAAQARSSSSGHMAAQSNEKKTRRDGVPSASGTWKVSPAGDIRAMVGNASPMFG